MNTTAARRRTTLILAATHIGVLVVWELISRFVIPPQFLPPPSAIAVAFVTTIRSVAAGQKVLPPRMTQSLFSQIVNAARSGEVEPTLEDVRMTPRESEVIALIGEGLSNKEIAQRLNIASHTVKSHVRNVMDKLALHTRLQIAAYVRRDGA